MTDAVFLSTGRKTLLYYAKFIIQLSHTNVVQHRGVDSNKLAPTHMYAKPGNFSSGQLVKDSNLLNPLYLVSPACDSTRLTLPIGLWSTPALYSALFFGKCFPLPGIL